MLANALSTLGRETLRIVLPSWCIVCSGELPWRERHASACAPCWSALPRIHSAKCVSCALPLEVADDASDALHCVECMADPLPVDWCEAWGHYRGGLEKVLHAFKFERHDFLDHSLAALLDETVRSRGDLAFDAIVPVPMFRRKERRRGYNQAELIARALAGRTGVACEPSLLVKTLERETQSQLARGERARNVRGVFQADITAKGRSILLVDDICTTGETLRACARALLAQKAARVCAIAVAKTGK